MRNNTLSALVRNGKRDRLEAWKEYNTPPHIEKDLLEYFKKRLELSDEEYEKIMTRKPKSWTEYPTYKKTFELLRPLFKILAKANLVPMSFYLKYVFQCQRMIKNDYNCRLWDGKFRFYKKYV